MEEVQKYKVVPYPISTILTWAKSKEIAIPEIQRPFVWNSTQVRDLIDSLYRGYPVGFLITWKDPKIKLKGDGEAEGKKIVIGDATINDYTNKDEVKAIKNGLERLEELKAENPGLKIKSTEMHVKLPVKLLTDYTEKDNLMFKGFIDAVFEHDNGIFLVDYKTDKNTNYASHHKRQLAVYKKMYSQLENIPEEKIETCIIFVRLRGGINTGKSDSAIDYGKRNVYGTFDGHLQKVLEWKKNPDTFIEELIEQPTQDTLHGAIKDKLVDINKQNHTNRK